MLLVVDAYGCSKLDLLTSEQETRKLLNDVAYMTNMRLIGGPFVQEYRDPLRAEDWGITGVCVIAESHIAIHTWPEHRYVHFVLDSCRDFETSQIQRYVGLTFDAEKLKVDVVESGLRYGQREGFIVSR